MRPGRALSLLLLLGANACSGPSSGAPASPSSAASGSSPATPTAQAGVSPSGQPSSSPVTQLPNFACSDQSGGSTAARASVTDVRVSANTGFDRFVVQFKGGVPAYSVRRQGNASFVLSPKGEQVTLAGAAGVQVALLQTTGAGSYAGSTDFKPNYSVLKEARQLEDFEAVVQWGLGLAKAACLRAFSLSQPDRLVIDLSTA